MAIRRRLIKTIVDYIVFAEGRHYPSAGSALSSCKSGEWVREYTILIKKIELGPDNNPTGTYMTSRPVKEKPDGQ